MIVLLLIIALIVLGTIPALIAWARGIETGCKRP